MSTQQPSSDDCLDVDPDAERFLASQPRQRVAMRDCDLDWLREQERRSTVEGAGPTERVRSVRDRTVGDVPVRIYQPGGNSSDHALVWFHGGAFILGNLDSCDAILRQLANLGDWDIISVDYRLAPEHPYPAAPDDCWRATEWAASNYRTVAVGGDSAGGTLAAAVAARARSTRLELAGQVLVYPALDSDLDAVYRSEFQTRYADFCGDDWFARDAIDSLRYAWNSYLDGRADCPSADAVPLHADRFDDLPPTLLINAEHDPLAWEADRYATALRTAGVPVAERRFSGQVHGFFTTPGTMRAAATAAREIADQLHQLES